MYIFGGMSVVSGLIALMLRETKGEMMADTVNQEEERSSSSALIRKLMHHSYHEMSFDS